MRKRKKFEDDDGRTIVNMNVDGMPWYASSPSRSKRKPTESESKSGTSPASGSESFGKAENLAVAWGVLKAILLVTAVFVVGYLLFILFCVLVWFR